MKIKILKFMKLSGLISKLLFLIISGIAFTGIDYSYNQSNKTEIHLLSKLNFISENEKILVWIYFKDKGGNDNSDNIEFNQYLSEKSIDRRMKRIKNDRKFDQSDIPVNNDYVREITGLGIEVKHKSKWFNSVSCYADKNQIELASKKDFVKSIDMVLKYKKYEVNQFEFQEYSSDNNSRTSNMFSINYGPSLPQDTLISIPQVHGKGYTGEGVLIASFDAGFNNLGHPCFDKIREKGLRTYDFVNGDTIVADGTGRMGSGAHGILTLSLVGGYDPGNLISPAFDSKYILAKTENTDSETPLEEDNWVAAAEWADSLGADIITCSLGYLAYQPPYTSYTWESMDGNTALISRAADIAVSKGITVVIAAGNGGYNSSHNTLNAPADAFNVITVGSVSLNRQRSSFSSVGPTTDGRIKPEVTALGNNNYCASPGSGNTGYTTSSTGTSLACPMVAGVCALLLSADNSLTPAEVKQILTSTSDNNVSPNSLTGWGTVNASYALDKVLGTSSGIPEIHQLNQNFPNPFNPSTTISYSLSNSGFVAIKIYDINGKEVSALINKQQSPGIYDIKYTPENISGGIYFYSLYVNEKLESTRKFAFIK